MKISIIITTKNEEKNIENCLESIKAQTYPQKDIEIILVDNFSTDKTQSLAKKYTEKAFEKGPERSVQRNFGVEKSEGEYFLYLDADMILDKDVVKKCVDKVISIPETVGLYLPEIVMGSKFFSKVRRFERSFYDGTVIDCARFIKKDVFLKVGGFDKSMTGPEDWDLDKKLRASGKVYLIDAPIHHNETEFNLKKYLSKKGYYSRSFDTYSEKWGKDDPDVKKQLGVYYRFFGVFVEDGRWKRLASHPLLAAGMFILRFLVGLKFITR